MDDSTPASQGWNDYFWSWFPDDEAAKYEVQISWYLMIVIAVLLVLISITWWQFKDVLFAIYTNPAEFDMTQRHRSPRNQDTQPLHSSPRPRAQKAAGTEPSPHTSKRKSQLHWSLNPQEAEGSMNANPLTRTSAGSSSHHTEGFVPPNPDIPRNTSAFTPGPVAEPDFSSGIRHRHVASADTAASDRSWVFDKAMRRMGSDASLPATIDDM